jgi:hypothetical protein
MNDDDRTLTTYPSWRAGATIRPDPRLTARVDYAGRVKKDQEELTLLKDVEASRIRAKLEFQPVERLTIGGDFTKRERELPDIGVSVDGTVTGALLRYEVPGWGAASADYSHATYLDVGKDLDIEKSTVFVEAALKLAGRYHLEAKYNCHNYDDYILVDRYYTANVVRVDLGYDLLP